ncbi:hypothetical protein BH11PSE13_BH11PSE13_02450 [soil metagenome]
MLRTFTVLALATFLSLGTSAAESTLGKPSVKSEMKSSVKPAGNTAGNAARKHGTAKASAKPAIDPNALAAALGTYPAKVEYASNDAPFVVFDISPRKLELSAGAADPKEALLTFVATDVLSYVNVFMYSASASASAAASTQAEPKEVPGRTACGSKTPGHYSCTVPLRAALAQLQGGDGFVGLRIETEGLDGDRSTVRVTLPVKAAATAPAVSGKDQTPSYRHALTFIVDSENSEYGDYSAASFNRLNRPAVHPQAANLRRGRKSP